MELKIASVLIIVSIGISTVAGVCLNQKYTIVPGHTGCIAKSPFAQPLEDVSLAVQQEIVDIHNNLRATMRATNMQRMVWDDELAQLSQKWADNCEFKHDSGKRAIPGRFSVGQNLGLGHQSWSAVLNSWWNEINDFDYNNRSVEFSRVGHYTQMAWAESAKVGCALSMCTNPEMLRFFGGRYYVCNYGAAGNREWWIPYNKTNSAGDTLPCSSCPNSCDAQGLCDCGGKVCQNGGALDVNTCQCRCVKPFHTPTECGLDCQRAVDSRHCGVFWQPSHCTQFTNVPNECPHMCGLCPLADFRTQSSNTGSPLPPVISNTNAPVTTRQTTTTPRPTTQRRTTTASVITQPAATQPPPPPPSPTTTSATANSTVEIKIEEKAGNTVITIPNKRVPNSNGTVQVVQQPTSGALSTLVLILQLV